MGYGYNCTDQRKCGNNYYCYHVDNSSTSDTLCNYNNCPIHIMSSSSVDNFIIYAEIHNEIDAYIWRIFNRYIEEFKISFSSPETWTLELDRGAISFEGSDGCRGCYDSKTIGIQLNFFTDTEAAFQELHRQREEFEAERKRADERRQRKADYKEYQRLKAIFED